jgi:hypothetical protein
MGPLAATIGIGGAAAGGAAAAGSGITALTALKTIGTGLGIVGQIASLNYQSAVASRQEAMFKQEADLARQNAAVEQQDAALEAKAEIDAVEARNASSGLLLNSTSFQRQRKAAQMLARRDALRIQQEGDRRALSLNERAFEARATAKSAKTAKLFAIGSGIADLSGDMISSASYVNRSSAAAIRRETTRI